PGVSPRIPPVLSGRWQSASVARGSVRGPIRPSITMTSIIPSWARTAPAPRRRQLSKASDRVIRAQTPDYDPEDVKFTKQQFDGISECKSVKDPRELGRRLEDSIMDQFAVNTRCGGVAAYIAG